MLAFTLLMSLLFEALGAALFRFAEQLTDERRAARKDQEEAMKRGQREHSS